MLTKLAHLPGSIRPGAEASHLRLASANHWTPNHAWFPFEAADWLPDLTNEMRCARWHAAMMTLPFWLMNHHRQSSEHV